MAYVFYQILPEVCVTYLRAASRAIPVDCSVVCSQSTAVMSGKEGIQPR